MGRRRKRPRYLIHFPSIATSHQKGLRRIRPAEPLLRIPIMKDDPNLEGEFENGCHHWLSDSLSITIETTRALHEEMLFVFERVRRAIKPPEPDSKTFIEDLVAQFKERMSRTSEPLIKAALTELRAATDPEDRPGVDVEFANPAVKADLQSWLYRRYKLWQSEAS